MNSLKFMADSDILTYVEYDYLASFWYIVRNIVIFAYHIAPIVLLLFIARVVWLIYINTEKRWHDNDMY